MLERMVVGPEDDLAAVVAELRARGYEDCSAIEGGAVRRGRGGPPLAARDLFVDAAYRFEGKSNPSDMAIILAVRSETGWKGNVVAGYGPSASSREADLLSALPHPRRAAAGSARPDPRTSMP